MAISAGQPGRRRRRHSEPFKNEVVQACGQPGVSMAAVAMANGLNANLVRRWVVETGHGAVGSAAPLEPDTLALEVANCAGQAGAFVPVKLQAPAGGPDIRIELSHNGTVVSVSWPLSAAAHCAAWLREVWR